MKIALFTDTYPPFINGVSTSCFNLAQTLKEHGHEVLIVTPRNDNGPLEYVDGIVKIPGIELKRLYGYRFTSIFPSKAYRIVRDFRPDIIHNQTDSTIGQFSKIVAKNMHLPLVHTYHTSYEDYTHYFTKGYFDRFAKHVVRTYTKNLADNVTEFITPSNKTKEYLRYSGSDVFINVVPTGIDFSVFNNHLVHSKRIADFKKEHNIEEGTKIFLLLGRVAKEKSMDFSLKCFSMFVQKHPDIPVRMVVVGGGPQLDELKDLSKALNIDHLLHFIGPVPASEVPFYYHLANIYTSASLTETQGLTYMEAMASSTIVLARFDTQLAETIIDSETGFFFRDEIDFIVKTERILNMDQKELNGIKRNALSICDHYSLENFYLRIMEVYQRAIRKCW